MRILFIPLIILIQLQFSGCGGMPMSADEFRSAVPNSFGTEIERFEVDRPVQDVGDTFKKLAPKCLDQTIRTTSLTANGQQVVVTNWTPTVIAGRNKAELHLQRLFEQGGATSEQEPSKGRYVLVVDATPRGADKTEIVMYRPAKGVNSIARVIKSWASGKNLNCPNLTRK